MGAARTLGAQWGWTGRALVRDLSITLDETGRIQSLETVPGQPPGLLSPGLINAHTHLELAGPATPGGAGMVPWVDRLLASPRSDPAAAAQVGVAASLQAGVVGLVDVSNTGASRPALRESPLSAAVMGELIGWSEALWEPALARVAAWEAGPRLAVLPTAHSLIGCAAPLVAAALGSPGQIPAGWSPLRTLHCDESPDDAPLLREQSGPWADWLSAMGRPWRPVIHRAASGVQALAGAGLLHAGLGLVHLTAATETDIQLLARRGVTAILCPRSNLHITGRLPPVEALRAAGVPLALGTDSLASNTDLDPLAEAVVLARAFPDLPPETWMTALTAGGARVLGDPARGHLRPGLAPGLVCFSLPSTSDPLGLLFAEPGWPREVYP